MLERLHQNLSDAGIPVLSVEGDGPFVVVYKSEATAQQRTDGAALVASFDPSQVAQDAWLVNNEPFIRDLRADAALAMSTNATFLLITTPSAAQNAAQAKALTRQNQRMIPLLLRVIELLGR